MRKWILKILGITQELELLKEATQIQNEFNRMAADKIEALALECQALKDLLDHTRSLIYVGVDVGHPKYGDPTWCVVAVKGPDENHNVVRYFRIHWSDYKELKEILRQFEGTNTSIDAPRGMPSIDPNPKYFRNTRHNGEW